MRSLCEKLDVGRHRSLRALQALTILLAATFVTSACTPLPSERATFVDSALEILDRGIYATGTDWDQARAKGRAALLAAGEGELGRELSFLTRTAGGRHSRFLSADSIQAEIEAADDALVAVPTVTIEGGVGTLVIPSFGSSDETKIQYYLESARSAITTSSSAAVCGWQIDLRGNSGGKSYEMLRAVLPFFGDTVLLEERYRSPPETISVSASPRGLLVGNELLFDDRAGEPDLSSTRVAVLQSRQTASAAEQVLVAFRERANTRSFGQRSAGFTSLNGLFDLSDGSALLLSIGFLHSAAGEEYTGSIDPDVDDVAARQQGEQTPEDAAREWITKDCTPGIRSLRRSS